MKKTLSKQEREIELRCNYARDALGTIARNAWTNANDVQHREFIEVAEGFVVQCMNYLQARIRRLHARIQSMETGTKPPSLMASKHLTACPFCDSPSVDLDVREFHFGKFRVVSCRDCSASGPTAENDDDACSYWNERSVQFKGRTDGQCKGEFWIAPDFKELPDDIAEAFGMKDELPAVPQTPIVKTVRTRFFDAGQHRPPTIAIEEQPETNPEYEQKAAQFRDELRKEHPPEGTRESLLRTLHVLDVWVPASLPANEHGQVDFVRALCEGAADEIRAFLKNTSDIREVE